jgi:hypothetical protein
MAQFPTVPVFPIQTGCFTGTENTQTAFRINQIILLKITYFICCLNRRNLCYPIGSSIKISCTPNTEPMPKPFVKLITNSTTFSYQGSIVSPVVLSSASKTLLRCRPCKSSRAAGRWRLMSCVSSPSASTLDTATKMVAARPTRNQTIVQSNGASIEFSHQLPTTC